jgi:hypothetical protein
MAFAEDLDIFFDLDGFALACVINTDPPRTIMVIFSTPTEEVAMYEANVEASAPFLKCKTSEISGVKDGNTATVNAKVYKIRRIENEGTGTSRLHLKK